MLNQRTTILLDEDTQRLLVSIARQEKTSVGDLVRQAIKKMYKKRDEDILKKRKQAVVSIMRLRKKMKPLGNITYRQLIDYGRYR